MSRLRAQTFHCSQCGKNYKTTGEPKCPVCDPPSAFRCGHCGKTVVRNSGKKWIKSFCETTGKNARLMRLPNLPLKKSSKP